MSDTPVNGAELSAARALLAGLGGKACKKKHGKAFYKSMSAKGVVAKAARKKARAEAKAQVTCLSTECPERSGGECDAQARMDANLETVSL